MPPIGISARYDTTDKNIEIYSVTNSSGSSSASAGTTSTPISTLIKSIGTNELDLNPTIAALPGSDIQLEMRIADTVKDCISTKTRASIDNSLKGVIQKIYSTRNNITSDFHGITDPIFQYFKSSNKENIKPRIFLKGDIISSAYFNVRFCIAESGMGVEKWAKNRTRVKVIGTFSEAADPAPRTNPDLLWTLFDDWIEFNSAILNGLFKFPPGSTWKATRINGSSIDKNYALDGCFTYEIVVGLKQGTTPISVNGTSGHKELPNDSSNPNYEYFKGNATKNTYLNVNASSANATNPNQKDANALVECYKYIVLKEMGDVMQVLQFFIWCQLYCQEYNREPVVEFPYPDTDEEGNETGTSTPPLLEDVLIYTTDGVVFSLCNMLKVPCLYTGGGHTALHYIPVKESINNILKKTLTEAMDFILAFNRNLKMNLVTSLLTNDIHFNKEGRGGTRVSICTKDLVKDRITKIISFIDIYNKALIDLVNAYIVYIEGTQFTDVPLIQNNLDIFIKRIKQEINPNLIVTPDDDIDLEALKAQISTATIDSNESDVQTTDSPYNGGFLFPQLLILEYNKGSVNDDGTQRQLKTINKYILLGYLAEPCLPIVTGGTIIDFDNNNSIIGGNNTFNESYFGESVPLINVEQFLNQLDLIGIDTEGFLIIIVIYLTTKELVNSSIEYSSIEDSSIVIIYNKIVYDIHKNFSYFNYFHERIVIDKIIQYFKEFYYISDKTFLNNIEKIYFKEKKKLEIVKKFQKDDVLDEYTETDDEGSQIGKVEVFEYAKVIKFIDDSGLYFCTPEDDKKFQEEERVYAASGIMSVESPSIIEYEDGRENVKGEVTSTNSFGEVNNIENDRVNMEGQQEETPIKTNNYVVEDEETMKEQEEQTPIKNNNYVVEDEETMKGQQEQTPIKNNNYVVEDEETMKGQQEETQFKRKREEEEEEELVLKPVFKRSSSNPPKNENPLINPNVVEMETRGGSKSNKNKTKKHKKSKKQRKNIKNKSKKQKKTRKNKSSKNKK
jgi:hypothetical protein